MFAREGSGSRRSFGTPLRLAVDRALLSLFPLPLRFLPFRWALRHGLEYSVRCQPGGRFPRSAHRGLPHSRSALHTVQRYFGIPTFVFFMGVWTRFPYPCSRSWNL